MNPEFPSFGVMPAFLTPMDHLKGVDPLEDLAGNGDEPRDRVADAEQAAAIGELVLMPIASRVHPMQMVAEVMLEDGTVGPKRVRTAVVEMLALPVRDWLELRQELQPEEARREVLLGRRAPVILHFAFDEMDELAKIVSEVMERWDELDR